MVRSAGTLSRLSAALRPLSRHSVALTKLPYALLFLLRYGKNERKKWGEETQATATAKPCILSAVAPATVGERAIKRQSEGRSMQPTYAATVASRPLPAPDTFKPAGPAAAAPGPG